MLPEPWERRLPLGLEPQQGESLTGYVLCLAERLLTDPVDVAVRTGLSTSRASVPMTHASALDEATAARFACATGLRVEQVQGLTLSVYDRTLRNEVLGDAGPQAWRSLRGRLWAAPPRTRYCPQCLAESRSSTGLPVWRLSWHTAWSFACTRHRRLLADSCPACGTVVGLGRPVNSLLPRAGGALPADACSARLGGTTCGHPLGAGQPDASARALGGDAGQRVLTAQAHLDQLLEELATAAPEPTSRSLGRTVSATQYLRDVRFLAVLLDGAAEGRGDWDGTADPRLVEALGCSVTADRRTTRPSAFAKPPPEAGLNALLVTTAVEHLALSAAQAVGPVVRAHARAHQTSSSSVNRLRFTGPSRALQDLLGASNRRGLATGTLLGAVPEEDGASTATASTVPAHLPENEYAEWFGWIPGRSARGRRIAAVSLRQIATGESIDAAGQALGLPAGSAPAAGVHFMRQLPAQDGLPRFRESIGRLAAAWNSKARPDYAARRALMAEWVMPADDWNDLLSTGGARRGHRSVDWESRRSAASVSVWAAVTGGESMYCPLVLAEPDKADRFDRLLYRLHILNRNKRLRAGLAAYAETLAVELDALTP